MQLCRTPFRVGRLVCVDWLPSSITLEHVSSIPPHRLLSLSCAITSFLSFLSSLWLCATLDHFGYPTPLFSGWRQARWYNLHLTEVWLCYIHQNIIDGHEPLPTIRAILVDLPSLENISGPSLATTPPNAITSSSGSAFTAKPTVAFKEPRNRALHEQVVCSTVGIGVGRKPTLLDLPSSTASSCGKWNRSPPRNGKDKKSTQCTPCAKALPSVDSSTTQKHGSSTSAESDDDSN